MELPHFNRTLTSIVSGSILTFTLILGYHNEIRNLFEFENNRIANFFIDNEESNLILYPQSNYYSTPEKFVIKDYKLNIKIDPKADITYKIHSYFPEDFIKAVIFITLFAFIYIVGEAITTLADLGLWWIFRTRGIRIFITPLKSIYAPFIYRACKINSNPKNYLKKFVDNYCKTPKELVEYITNSCPLNVSDFIRISNKTDNYFLQESERYFDYSLFFGSVGLALFINFSILFVCSLMLKINSYNFIWIIIFLVLFILSSLLAIYNRFKANLFLKLAAKSVEDITTNRN